MSRHLKLLDEANLLDRTREGSRVYYRVAADGPPAELAAILVDLIPDGDDTLGADLAQLARARTERVRRAEAYFRENAGKWDDVRNLYIDERKVDAAIGHWLAEHKGARLLDIGTGTGRVLTIASPHVGSAIGIDNSVAMLAIARARIGELELGNCQVRQADMYRLPFDAERFDVVCANMVAHYAEDPGAVMAEGARVLRTGGHMVIVDFAPHELTELRDEQAHRWLGFSDAEMTQWLERAGLEGSRPTCLAGDPLTVCIWTGQKPANQALKGNQEDYSHA